MNRTQIRNLQSVKGYPSVSVLMPTHRLLDGWEEDRIRTKNLVKEATERLTSEFSRREVEPILKKLNSMATEIEERHKRDLMDGLAFLVNRDFADMYVLPYPVRERVVVDEGFATRDLVFALNRTPRYWVLVLSEQDARLYAGYGSNLKEVDNEHFPILHYVYEAPIEKALSSTPAPGRWVAPTARGRRMPGGPSEGVPGGPTPLAGSYVTEESDYLDEQMRKFYLRVDEAFGHMFDEEPLPTVLVGVERHAAFFRNGSEHVDAIVGEVHGSHEATPVVELSKLVWPVMDRYLDERAERVLKRLDEAIGFARAITGIRGAWQVATQGGVDTLLVERDFFCPAELQADGMQIEPLAEDVSKADVPDAVDEIVEMVLSKGGEVVFVAPGALEKYGRIAMILRY